jgi:hypothetical protein
MFGAFGPGTHQLGRSPASQQQIDGIENNRFAGPGLSTQYGQAAGEVDLQVIDDGKIADGQLF